MPISNQVVIHAEHCLPLAPSAWVRQHLSLIPKNTSPVLDLACGQGRHTRLLLDAGYEVWALDKNQSLLTPLQALGVKTLHVDLEAMDVQSSSSAIIGWPFSPEQFAGIVVTNYLHRPLLKHLAASLQDQGVLIYETFAEGNQVYGRPSNPDFLLKPGELLTLCAKNVSTENDALLHCIAYQHGYIGQPQEAIVQRICACRTVNIHAIYDRLAGFSSSSLL
jgi:SAM-dependent methyltransferase